MSISNAVWSLLLQAQPVVQQAEPSLFHRIADVAGGIVNILLVLVVLALFPLLLVVMKLIRRLTSMLEQIQGEIRPISLHAATIADNVNYVSTAVRADVQRVSDTITAANRRVNEAIEVAEDRVRELHAVLDVVQDEAQETLIAAAATMRGVREGAAAFGDHLTGDLMASTDGDEDDENGFNGDGERDGERTGPRIRRRGGRHGEA